MNGAQCFGGGLLLGALVATAVDGTLSPSPQMSSKPVIEQRQEPVLVDDPLQVFLTEEQAEAVYPSLRVYADGFTQRDITALRDPFSVSDVGPVSEANLCHYDTFVGKQTLTEGTCFFIAPHLALTSYHVATIKDPDSFSEFYELTHKVRTSNGKTSSVETLAVSPLHDLALVKTEKAFPVSSLSLGYYDGGLSSLLLSFDEETDTLHRYTSTSHLAFEQRFVLLENGTLGPSALVLPELYSPGNSGSPLFQDGRLVGLVSYVDERDKKTFVSSHVRKFVSEILKTFGE